MNDEYINGVESEETPVEPVQGTEAEEAPVELVQGAEAEETPAEFVQDTETEEIMPVTEEVNCPEQEAFLMQTEDESWHQPESLLMQTEDESWHQPENSPFSPLYVPEKRKNNNRVTIILLALLLLLLISGLIFAVSKLLEAAASEMTVAWKQGNNAVEKFLDGFGDSFKEEVPQDEFMVPQWPEDEMPDGMEDFLGEYFGDGYDYGFPFEDPYSDGYGGDDFGGYDDFTGGDYEEEIYVPTQEDEYYVEITDSISDDLSYSVEIKEYESSDMENSVYIYVSYVQVSDDMVNSEEINRKLLDGAMYHAHLFDAETPKDYMLEAESYVTYMDEEILSVAVVEYIYAEDETVYDIYSMNFDVKTGELLDNTKMIEISDKLAEAFVNQSNYQNGYTYAVSDYSVEQIVDFMKNEDMLILFYTPVGLEIGYNHPDGWITATIKEYKQYLKK